MKSKRGAMPALSLAVRHRRWQVEAGMPELARGIEAEAAAQAAQDEAKGALERAHAARGDVLARASFDAEALMRHAAYGAVARAELVRADAEVQEATREADGLRARARELVAERDAYQQRLEHLDEAARVLASRRVARDIDELWLLRRAPEGSREDGGGTT